MLQVNGLSTRVGFDEDLVTLNFDDVAIQRRVHRCAEVATIVSQVIRSSGLETLPRVVVQWRSIAAMKSCGDTIMVVLPFIGSGKKNPPQQLAGRAVNKWRW